MRNKSRGHLKLLLFIEELRLNEESRTLMVSSCMSLTSTTGSSSELPKWSSFENVSRSLSKGQSKSFKMMKLSVKRRRRVTDERSNQENRCFPRSSHVDKENLYESLISTFVGWFIPPPGPSATTRQPTVSQGCASIPHYSSFSATSGS